VHTFKFDAIGTQWQVDSPENIEPALQQAIRDQVADFDATYSRFRSDTIVARMASASSGGIFGFPEDAPNLFGLYDQLHLATDGAVDPLVGRDLELLGYDRDYSLSPDPDAIAQHALDRPNWRRDVRRDGACLTTQRPLVLDLGAAGKGYLVDIVSELLRRAGHKTFIVDGSGDIRYSGADQLTVGLEHPGDPTLVIGVARIADQALCASATNRRAWSGVHHVIDARNGLPADQVAATWVVANDAATADGLATALFFSTPHRLSHAFDFAFVRMFSDGRAEVSDNFPGEIFS
jgi:FAD:protein FMN transferase